jgi:hypothetical protein
MDQWNKENALIIAFTTSELWLDYIITRMEKRCGIII